MSTDFRPFRRKQIAELRPYVPGEPVSPTLSISAYDRVNGSPKEGDMIARNPKNHEDQWLVAAAYFAENFEPIDAKVAAVYRVKPEHYSRKSANGLLQVDVVFGALRDPDGENDVRDAFVDVASALREFADGVDAVNAAARARGAG